MNISNVSQQWDTRAVKIASDKVRRRDLLSAVKHDYSPLLTLGITSITAESLTMCPIFWKLHSYCTVSWSVPIRLDKRLQSLPLLHHTLILEEVGRPSYSPSGAPNGIVILNRQSITSFFVLCFWFDRLCAVVSLSLLAPFGVHITFFVERVKQYFVRSAL